MPTQASGTRVHEAPARIRYPNKEDAAALATLRHRNRRDRLVAVVKTWAICWLAAVAAVFLPVLHFILVPSLLIGGPIYALAQGNEHTTLMRATGKCPACDAPVVLTQKRRAVPTIAFRCDSCGRPLELLIDAAVLEDNSA